MEVNGDLFLYLDKNKEKRASLTPRHVFILPVKSNKLKDFTGRGEEFKRLEELLLAPDGKKLAGIVGLAGIGGIGKSALASYFAEQHKADFPDGVIGLQVNKKEPAAIVREFARTAHVENYACIDGVAAGRQLLEAGLAQVQRFGTEVLPEDLLKISQEKDGLFAVEVESGRIARSRSLILAMGMAKSKLGVLGESEFCWPGRELLC